MVSWLDVRICLAASCSGTGVDTISVDSEDEELDSAALGEDVTAKSEAKSPAAMVGKWCCFDS